MRTICEVMAKKTSLFRSISNQIIIIYGRCNFLKIIYMLSCASAHLISVLCDIDPCFEAASGFLIKSSDTNIIIN